MLVAYNEENKLINLLEQDANGKEFTCPACRGRLRLKNGTIVRKHFAHISLQDCQFYTENESTEHLNIKAFLFSWGKKTDSIRVEVFLPKLQQVADLLINDKIALEVQCSTISQQRLRERTINYHQHGYSVLWLLGKKLWLKKSINSLQKHFLYFSSNMGFHIWEIDEKKQELRLKYLIHEDLRGSVYYKTKTFKFGEEKLMDCLRTPFQKQAMTSMFVKQDQTICQYIRKQLYYQQNKWMKLQENLYLQGKNLLTQTVEDFFPQVQPIRNHYFCQISQCLDVYYDDFLAYYKNEKNKEIQIIYPPAFYKRFFGKNVIK